MKLAICYGGNLRTYEYCVKNHAEIIGDADIYISTWDEIQISDKINDSWHHKINIDYPKVVTEDYIKSVTPKNFNIKSIKIDNYSNAIVKPIKNYSSLNYQYIKIKDAYNLITNKNYDFIIRLRPDITINNIKYSKDKIIYNEYIWYDYLKQKNIQVINEMIWVCKPELMEKTIKIYDNLEKINGLLDFNLFFGESICYKNLEIENLLDDVELYNFDYRVIR
jgi:hypothetical protein